MASSTLSSGMSITSEISSTDGRRSFSCSNFVNMRLILFIDPSWFNGSLTIRLCSAIACRILWRIHQTAYEMNLNPLVSSYFSAAFISPTLPSLMRSGSDSPWFWYCLATLTTNLRFDFVSFSKAFLSPLRIRCASSTSSSADRSSSLPISDRYFSNASLSRFVIDLLIFSCLMQ